METLIDIAWFLLALAVSLAMYDRVINPRDRGARGPKAPTTPENDHAQRTKPAHR